ncbi:MAG: tRNA lysidine(34) synthetase TilS [Hyphomicrobium sp.]
MRRRTSKCAPSRSANASAVPDDDTGGTVIAAEPISDAERNARLAVLQPFRVLILAVSGGADSLAMMHLVAGWSRLNERTQRTIIVATVDHGLRPESGSEAQWVANEARALGLAHETLVWVGEKPEAGIQDAAREARYHLLAELGWRLRDAGPVAIVTAHTQDDQAETFLMRLARGSGLDGLTGMSIARRLGREADCKLVRPFLGLPGARLTATLKSHGLEWIEDPSNEQDQFERVRVRKARGELERLGLTNEKIALSAQRLERARAALDAAAVKLQSESNLDVHDGAFADFDAQAFFAAAEELRLRLLARLVCSFGGQEEVARLAKLEALVDRLAQPGFEGATLGGCIVFRRGDKICVVREPGRAALPELALPPGHFATWDRRFQVWASPEVLHPLIVRVLGANCFAQLRKQLEGGQELPPARAAATLPSFWQGEELFAVPQLFQPPHPFAGYGPQGQRLCSAEFLW